MATEHRTEPDHGNGASIERPRRLLSEVGLVRLGGVFQLAAIGMLVGSSAMLGLAGFNELTPDPNAIGPWLAEVHAGHTTYVVYAWILAVEHLVEIVFMVALYQLLREAGSAVRLALVTGILGLLLVAVSGTLSLGVAELASRYVTVDGPSRLAVVAAAASLEQIRQAVALLGTVLAWGVGGAIFSAAILRTSLVSRWLGWGGLVVALLMWLGAFQLVARVFESVLLLGLLVGAVWLLALAITLVRIDPDRVPTSSQQDPSR